MTGFSRELNMIGLNIKVLFSPMNKLLLSVLETHVYKVPISNDPTINSSQRKRNIELFWPPGIFVNLSLANGREGTAIHPYLKTICWTKLCSVCARPDVTSHLTQKWWEKGSNFTYIYITWQADINIHTLSTLLLSPSSRAGVFSGSMMRVSVEWRSPELTKLSLAWRTEW